MKTAINQSVTVLSLFTLAFTATLTISWGITKVTFEEEQSQLKNKFIIHLEKEVKNDFTRTFKYLIPKLK